MNQPIAARLAALGFTLPEPPVSRGLYTGVVIHRGVAMVSGQVSRVGDDVIAGPVTTSTPTAVIVAAAQASVLRALATLDRALGGLDAIERILFLRGFVFAGPDFHDHSRVLDPASALLIDLFGEAGRHARSAIGVAGLPSGGLLESELTVALSEA